MIADKERKTDLFLGSEVVDDVEETTDFFRGLPLNHIRDRFAADIAVKPIRKSSLDIRCAAHRSDFISR